MKELKRYRHVDTGEIAQAYWSKDDLWRVLDKYQSLYSDRLFKQYWEGEKTAS